MRHCQKSFIAQCKPIQWIKSGKWLTGHCWEPESLDESGNEQVVRVLGKGLAEALSFACEKKIVETLNRGRTKWRTSSKRKKVVRSDNFAFRTEMALGSEYVRILPVFDFVVDRMEIDLHYAALKLLFCHLTQK